MSGRLDSRRDQRIGRGFRLWLRPRRRLEREQPAAPTHGHEHQSEISRARLSIDACAERSLVVEAFDDQGGCLRGRHRPIVGKHRGARKVSLLAVAVVAGLALLMVASAGARPPRWWSFTALRGDVACRAYWHGTGYIACTWWRTRSTYILEATSYRDGGGRAHRTAYRRLRSRHVLRPGQHIDFGWWNITCESSVDAMICANSAGHGLWLSWNHRGTW